MRRIFKYAVSPHSVDPLFLPEGFKILSLQQQNGIPCIWVLVDDDADIVPIIFHWYGTGISIEKNTLTYVGTQQFNDGSLVFHLFHE